MDLKKLEYFEAVARLNSFTKAAEELHVSQPTISFSIKKLEQDLGLHLLVRDKRQVLLTYEGEMFFEKTKNILESLDKAVLDMQELSSVIETTLNIGIAPISGAFLYGILYKQPWHDNLNVAYKILELGTYGILEAVANDELDIAYCVLESNIEQNYNTIISEQGEINVLVNRNHIFAEYERIPVRLLNNLNVVHYPTHSFLRRSIDRMCTDNNINFKIVATPVQMITVYDLVQKDIGISFVLGNSYADLTRDDTLVAIPLDPPLFYRTGFVWKKDKRLNRAAKLLIDYVNNIQK